jgi:TAG lipase/lysophosphatidylethanolamine acyltransferase
MLADNAWFRILRAIVNVLLEVTVFWWWRLYNYLRRNSPRDIYTRTLFNAHSYEEWEAAAFQLDEVLGNDLWYAYSTTATRTK